MARYATQADCNDEALAIQESDLIDADTYVDSVVLGLVNDLADVSLPNPHLTLLAATYAMALRAERSQGNSESLGDKSRRYFANAERQASRLTRKLLGVEASAASGGMGSIALFRG
jgi:hypothetical protein